MQFVALAPYHYENVALISRVLGWTWAAKKLWRSTSADDRNRVFNACGRRRRLSLVVLTDGRLIASPYHVSTLTRRIEAKGG
jgi:hypothetical protein